MSDFRQTFLSESIDNLTALHAKLSEYFDENLRQEAFRTIHSVKGGAQTFGLLAAARIADELENTLSASSSLADEKLLLDGVERLANALGENDLDCHADFVEKPENVNRVKTGSDILLTNIPPAVFRNFSEPERNAAVKALRDGKTIYCAEVGFAAANFAGEYRKLRKTLGEKSEIIASLPSEKYKAAGKIGFLIFLASHEPVENLQVLARDFDAEISSHACAENDSKYLYKMLVEVAAHAESIAARAGKQISVTILANDLKLSAAQMKTFFDILLHLVRNAADHAIERAGNIDIRFFSESDGLRLTVADDGKGIDAEKVRVLAVGKNLISGETMPAEREIFELIFAPEFSTATQITEISGRGVGLDAVKAAVESLHGKISVRNRKASGTIFEIFVPSRKNL